MELSAVLCTLSYLHDMANNPVVKICLSRLNSYPCFCIKKTKLQLYDSLLNVKGDYYPKKNSTFPFLISKTMFSAGIVLIVKLF